MSRKGTRKAAAANKKPKDTNAPKRPQSSYFLFMNERRPILKKQHSDMSMTDISKVISKEWKELADKTQYVEKAAQLKEAHKIALEEYKQTDAYKQYQHKLAEWQEAQNNAADSDAAETSTRGNGKRQVRGAAAKKNAAAAKRKKAAAAPDEDESSEEESGSSSSEEEESGSSEESESEQEVNTKKKTGSRTRSRGK